MYINRQIERFLKDHDLPATKFGRLVAGDPRLVLDMRQGREVRPPMQIKILAFMDGYHDTTVAQGGGQ
jgi:hypothetical protein